MADISVTPVAPRTYRVEVREGHRERVVRESFRFLLEREPATSILRQFSLSDISRFFPEYPSELARRLS
jgi:hypothetical protein